MVDSSNRCCREMVRRKLDMIQLIRHKSKDQLMVRSNN